MTVNAGGSSVKVHLFGRGKLPEASASIAQMDILSRRVTIRSGSETIREETVYGTESWSCHDLVSAVCSIVNSRPDIRPEVIAHRVKFARERSPVCEFDRRIYNSVLLNSNLARLHNPITLELYNITERAFPDATQLAILDSGIFFNDGLSDSCPLLPQRIRNRYELRSTGHHGLALEDVINSLDPPVGLKSICVHIGSGASVSGFVGKEPQFSSMVHASIDGPIMNSRSGSYSAGAVLKMMSKGASLRTVSDLLHSHSGIFALANQELEDRTMVKDTIADIYDSPFNVYIASFIREIVSAYSELSGCDVIVFSGGVARSGPKIVRMIVDFLKHMGLRVPNTDPILLPCRLDTRSGCVIAVCKEAEERVIAAKARSFVFQEEADWYECDLVVPGLARGPLLNLKTTDKKQVNAIILTEKLTTAAALSAQRFGGLIALTGDALGHGAAICREIGLPTVICSNESVLEHLGKEVFLDATEGRIRLCSQNE
ncbi:PEP-utilizing enzyme [Roseibium sp.]|uniref:PEP-utilizing enzyme n=1 Tax=Roseibium sp. TaxID=1936156 RepID=UPI003B51D7CF